MNMYETDNHIMENAPKRWNIITFELLFVLYLFAGIYKADQRFQWIPMDITELFFILSIFAGVFVFLRDRVKPERKAVILVLCGSLFVAYVIMSYTWTAGYNYASQKALYISTLNFWPLAACALIIAQDKVRVARLMNLILLFSMWVAVESTSVFVKNHGIGSIEAMSANYLSLGIVIGIGALIAIGQVFFSRKNRYLKLLLLLIFLYFMFLLLVLGGRGPFLAVIISLIVPVFLSRSFAGLKKFALKHYTIFILVLTLAAVIAIVYLYSKGLLAETLSRLLLLFGSDKGGSVDIRIEYYTASINLWAARPLSGYGIGSWPILMGMPDARGYPHNILLEIMVELGLFGLLLLCFIIYSAFKGFKIPESNKSFSLKITILMLFALVFIEAMFSGDIPDNRMLFAVLGLMAFGGSESK